MLNGYTWHPAHKNFCTLNILYMIMLSHFAWDVHFQGGMPLLTVTKSTCGSRVHVLTSVCLYLRENGPSGCPFTEVCIYLKSVWPWPYQVGAPTALVLWNMLFRKFNIQFERRPWHDQWLSIRQLLLVSGCSLGSHPTWVIKAKRLCNDCLSICKRKRKKSDCITKFTQIWTTTH